MKKRIWKHRNNYKYHYDRIFTREEIFAHFRSGWTQLLEDSFEMIGYVEGARICSAKRCLGMLHVYIRSDTDIAQNAAEGIAWKIERISSVICEECGNRGKRRKELKEIYCFCNDCYLAYLNEFEDPMKLFLRGHGGRFGKQKKEE